jgi:hypothetical protein
MNQQPQQQNDKDGKRGALNMLVFIARGFSLGTTVFIRRNFGGEGIGMPGFGTLIAIPAFGFYGQSPLMMYYLYAWMFAALMQRLQSSKNRRNGVRVHSYDQGTPYLGFRLGGKDRTGALRREFCFCIVVGVIVLSFDPAMGAFVIASAIGTAMNTSFQVELGRARQQRMQDAMLEAEYWTDQNR